MYLVLIGILMILAVSHAGVYHSREKKFSSDLASYHHDETTMEADNEGTADMILTDEQKEYFLGKNNATKRGMTNSSSWLWPNGIIPWQFDSTLANTTAKQVIRKAMEHIENKTCIRFKRRTNETGYINFVYGKYCSATIGYVPGQGRNVTISRTGLACTNGSMVHELGHVIGFFHEHSRPDRDSYVRINWTNILNVNEVSPSFQKFDTYTINSRNVPYDYASIMHYSRYFLAKDPRYPTVIPTRRNSDGSEVQPGYTKYLSPLDIKQANLLYGCRGSGRQTDEESDSGENSQGKGADEEEPGEEVPKKEEPGEEETEKEEPKEEGPEEEEPAEEEPGAEVPKKKEPGEEEPGEEEPGEEIPKKEAPGEQEPGEEEPEEEKFRIQI